MDTKQVIKALKISDIKISDIVIGTKKTNKKVPISLANKPLIYQTPYLEVVGGLKKTSYPNIYQLHTWLRGDTKKRIELYCKFIEDLESRISDHIAQHGAKWFTNENILIKSFVKESETDNKSFYIIWMIDLTSNIFVDENRKPFVASNLKDKDHVKMIVEMSELQIHENQCGISNRVQKIMVKPYVEKIENEYVFDSESDGAPYDLD